MRSRQWSYGLELFLQLQCSSSEFQSTPLTWKIEGRLRSVLNKLSPPATPSLNLLYRMMVKKSPGNLILHIIKVTFHLIQRCRCCQVAQC